MNPVNFYEIGYPGNATVYIEGNGTTNLPPLVSLVNPTNGAVFYTPVDISLVAFARDLDGYVTSMEFFSGTTSLNKKRGWLTPTSLESFSPRRD